MAQGQPRFIDIAANLTDCVFRGVSWKGQQMHEDDFDMMVQRFRSVGVDKVILSGTSYDVCVKVRWQLREGPDLFLGLAWYLNTRSRGHLLKRLHSFCLISHVRLCNLET